MLARRFVRLLLGVSALSGLLAFALRWYPAEPEAPASGFARASAAYQQLAAAQFETGMAPFPRSASALAALRMRISLPGQEWRETTSSDGGTVWQLGSALTLLMDSDGALRRVIYRLPDAGGLDPAGLGRALGELAGLGPQEQRPGNISGQVTDATLLEAPFYFDYSTGRGGWRFTPQFSADECVRLDVEQLVAATTPEKERGLP